MSKKQSKSGAKKKRAKKYRPLEEKQAAESPESSGGGGAMQSMVGGFRRAVGVEKSKKGKGDYIWTIVLVTLVCGALFWYLRFNN